MPQYVWITAPSKQDDRWILSIHSFDPNYDGASIIFLDNTITPEEIGQMLGGN